ncbi:hypothetical protein N787_09475 [Arenimonas metalli CF5-1]|uniref:Uncharacterized protein n=1 Tax=Arenimonas metalli CF5-1 TaxID=1384056 RepID=A0A091B4T6_9GAMM|nr:hypothetical protein N787_09475 [Arenimonas metalli CF5-1]
MTLSLCADSVSVFRQAFGGLSEAIARAASGALMGGQG